jgi:Subtilase family
MRGNSRVIGAGLIGTGLIGTGLIGTAVCATLALGAIPAGAATPTTRSQSASATADGTVPLIIFLASQPAAEGGATVRSGQRLALLQAAQAPLREQLQQLGATDVHGYQLVNALSARVPAATQARIAASPGVSAVIPDSPIVGPSLPVAAAAAPSAAYVPPTSVGAATVAATVATPSGTCSATTPQLSPDGLPLTHTESTAPGAVTARSLGYTGAGVKVAFLADGINPANDNLQRSGKSVITAYKDFSGDGPSAPTQGGEAFIDANAIAGQGRQVFNVAGFSAQSPGPACDIQIEGVAPGASVVALKVFSKDNLSTTSGFLQAIDYAVNVQHVNVLNESFGSNPFPDVTSLDAVEKFNDMAVRAGVTVVVAAGDAGDFNTIGSPAADPNVISVGASTDFRFYAQTDYAGADKFAPGGWENDNISSLSSGGFSQDGRTLDLVAPGDLSFASCTPDVAEYADCVNFLGQASPVEESGGTSEAAPEVAGAAALVIQAYRKAHGGDTPTPAVVRQILLSTAVDLGAPATEQGSGLLNSLKAVELASSAPGRHPVGETLRLSSNQLNYVGKPGAKASWAVTVTNTGAKAQTVAVFGRTFTADSVIKKASVTLSAKSTQFTNWAGAAANYATVRFTVPAGQAVLNSSIAWYATAAEASLENKRVRVILVDPSGRLAAHSLPQGVGGYGSAQVLKPAAGTWTAEIFSDTAKAGGTTGTVRFGASVEATARFGSVSPTSLRLTPGASKTVRVSAVVPAGAGDSSGAVTFDTGPAGGGPVSAPVTLRGLVPVGTGAGGTFSGTLTGGNGRAPGEGQVASYSFKVPSNLHVMLRDVEADVVLRNDPENQVSAYLVSPGGQTMGYGSNFLTTAFTSAGVPEESPRRQLSLYTSDPIPGVWTLIIDFTSPVPGNELADPFSGRIRFNSVRWSRGKLPAGPRAKLTPGRSYSYQIKLDNTGPAAEDVFLDARLPRLARYVLAPQDKVSGVSLPLAGSADPPEWIVPTMTHSVSASASSTSPVTFDFGPYPGDPDVESPAGRTVTAGFPAGKLPSPVTQGLWYAVPSETGPYGAGGAVTAKVGLTMSALTQEFDTTTSSPTGDFWRFGVASLAKTASYNLFSVNAGQTRTLTLTIRPSGKAGTVVRGVLYVDDFADSLQFLSGSQLVSIPYAYTIG